MPEQALGDFILDARFASGQIFRDLAKGLEISPSYFSKIENDRRAPLSPLLRSALETWPAVHPGGNPRF